MTDVPVPWKKITRGLPKFRRFADDRAPTIEEIRKMIEYPSNGISLLNLGRGYIIFTNSSKKDQYLFKKGTNPALNWDQIELNMKKDL
jgi:hypothetical protein